MWRLLMWIVALALTAGVVCIAVDAAQRIATFNVFTEGYGVPTISPPEAFEVAEWNIRYMFGLVVGVATGVALSLAAAIWCRLARSLLQPFSPNISMATSCQEGAPIAVRVCD